MTVLQNNQLTDELESQSKQTEKLLSKNQKLEETVSILKRDVEIHKKVELELAQKSQKAQNTINDLSKRVKEAEKVKESLVQEHKQSQQEFEQANNHDLDDKVYNLEKSLNDIHKNIIDLQKRKEKLQQETARVSAKIKILHENEHTCLSVLLEQVGLLQQDKNQRADDDEAELVAFFRSKINFEEW